MDNLCLPVDNLYRLPVDNLWICGYPVDNSCLPVDYLWITFARGRGGAGTSRDCYGNPLDTKKSEK